jgi:ADP-ribose pyrophosphatase YjhB (NUDIX family)
MKNVWSWIIIQDKRILLIKRNKNKKTLADFWALPWWWQEWDETPEETTIREVKEEVWLNFEIESLFCESPNEEVQELHHYNYIWKAVWKIVLQEEECDWYWWFNYEETKYLPIVDRMKEIIKKLFNENLID